MKHSGTVACGITSAAPDPFRTLVFRLGVIGARVEARHTEVLAVEAVKPKHVALLGALRMGAPGSQLELAALMQIAPSLVVALADELQALGAVVRERDPADRRRQRLALTPAGEQLLDRCAAHTAVLDAELVQTLGADATVAASALERLAVHFGLPVGGPTQLSAW